jgi:hypothetical protein
MTRRWKQIIGSGILAASLATGDAFAQAPSPGAQGGKLISPSFETPKFSDQNAARTKQNFDQLMESLPPTLRRVLQLDPTLLTNETYLAPYGQLTEFLQQHPEVAHNPLYFLGNPEYPDYYRERDRDGRTMEAVSIFAVFVVIAGTLLWMARTVVDHRRWLRLSKLQTEANAKLMERFTSTDDLLNFIQTPAGSRLMESSVVPVEPRAVGAPVNRILWSSQIGLVLLAIGGGMEFASKRGLDADSAAAFDTLGILILAAGIGFIASGVLSFLLSQRLGLMDALKMTPTSGGSAQKPS